MPINSSICCLLVYDISNRESFENCSKWLEETRNFTSKDVIIVLIGNKADLDNRFHLEKKFIFL